MLLNNDVDVRPDFLAELVRPLHDDPRVAPLRPLMLQPGERLIDSAGLATDAVLGGFPRLQGRDAAQAASRATAAGRPGGDGRRLPSRGVGAGRRPGRVDLRLHGGLRPRAAPAQRGLELGCRDRRDRRPSRLGHARPSLGAPASQRRLRARLHAAALRPAARPYGRARARHRGASWCSPTWRSRATCRRCAGVWRGGARRGSLPRWPRPPAEAIDATIGFRDSLRAATRGVCPAQRLTRARSRRRAARAADLRRPGRRGDGRPGHPLLGARAHAQRACFGDGRARRQRAGRSRRRPHCLHSVRTRRARCARRSQQPTRSSRTHSGRWSIAG